MPIGSITTSESPGNNRPIQPRANMSIRGDVIGIIVTHKAVLERPPISRQHNHGQNQANQPSLPPRANLIHRNLRHERKERRASKKKAKGNLTPPTSKKRQAAISKLGRCRNPAKSGRLTLKVILPIVAKKVA